MNKFVLGFAVLYWAYSVAKKLKSEGDAIKEDPERDIHAIHLPDHTLSNINQLSALPHDLHDYNAKVSMPLHVSAAAPRIAK